MDKPYNIWNMDESGFQPCKTNAKVYVGKDLKNAYSIDSPGGKQKYTVLFSVNAIGQYLPPYTHGCKGDQKVLYMALIKVGGC